MALGALVAVLDDVYRVCNAMIATEADFDEEGWSVDIWAHDDVQSIESNGETSQGVSDVTTGGLRRAILVVVGQHLRAFVPERHVVGRHQVRLEGDGARFVRLRARWSHRVVIELRR